LELLVTTVRPPVAFDPNAKCDYFLDYLCEGSNGGRKSQKISAAALGACFDRPAAGKQAIIFFYGQGANGKSGSCACAADILEMIIPSKGPASKLCLSGRRSLEKEPTNVGRT